MPVLTKKRPIKTKTVELHFLGPERKHKEAIKALKSLGFEDISDADPWRASFPYTDEQLPGISLAGARTKEGLTQRALSERTNIPQRHISEMENGKRPIGKEMAKKLGKALNLSYKVFL